MCSSGTHTTWAYILSNLQYKPVQSKNTHTKRTILLCSSGFSISSVYVGSAQPFQLFSLLSGVFSCHLSCVCVCVCVCVCMCVQPLDYIDRLRTLPSQRCVMFSHNYQRCVVSSVLSGMSVVFPQVWHVARREPE